MSFTLPSTLAYPVGLCLTAYDVHLVAVRRVNPSIVLRMIVEIMNFDLGYLLFACVCIDDELFIDDPGLEPACKWMVGINPVIDSDFLLIVPLREYPLGVYADVFVIFG